MDEVSGHHLVLCHSQDALHHSKMSSCSRTQTESSNPSDHQRLLTMTACLIRQLKDQSKQHLEDGQISDKLQQGSRDLEKAADRQKCAPISCWGDKTMTLQLAEQSRLQS